MQSAARAPGAAAPGLQGSFLPCMQMVQALGALALHVQGQWHLAGPGTAHTCSIDRNMGFMQEGQVEYSNGTATVLP
jgi:hypothetical protein